MAEKKSDNGVDLITLDVAGRLLMIGPERVRQLIKAGYITRPKPGYTTVISAVQGYIRFLKEDARKDTKTAAQSRTSDARARKIELEIAREERDLIPKADAYLAMDIVVAEVNQQLSGLAARTTRDVPLRREIEAKVHDAKARIAEALTRGKFLAATGGEASGGEAAGPS